MARRLNCSQSLIAITAFFLPLAAGWLSHLEAADLLLSWADNSNNENGFEIERKTGTNGTFAQVAIVGTDVTSYVDTGLPAVTTYCYRVRAYNSAGVSAFTPDGCATARTGGTTPLTAPTFDFSLAHSGNRAVTGGQSVSNVVTATLISGPSQPVSFTTSGLPAGTTALFTTINACAPTCSSALQYTTSPVTPVGIHPIIVTVGGGGVTRTTGFSLTVNPATTSQTTESYALSISVVMTLANGGSGNGAVSSSPAGINCGSDCAELYSRGTIVNLIATPAAGSVFAGWSGNADCNDGVVTMNADISCTATFSPQTLGLNLIKSGSGSGTVLSSPPGIICGSDCSESFSNGTLVNLTAIAAAGSVFSSWSRLECGTTSSCTVVVTGSTSVTAFFDTTTGDSAPAKIGVYRPSTGEFFLDRNGNGSWDGCSVDICSIWLAQSNGVPVAGSWDNTGTTRLGTFDSAAGAWYLDRNGNGTWDGCQVDICITSFGTAGDFPVVRNSPGSNRSSIGVFRSEVFNTIRRKKVVTDWGLWKFDANGNNIDEGCQIDSCFFKYGNPGNSAVVGDWDGNGIGKIGVLDAGQGFWLIDYNGNGLWDGCGMDKCLSTFGQINDLPVAGDWDGTGKAKIGVFRPSTGEWFLDKNGNGQLDACAIDICIESFGLAGDQPVIGKW